MTHGAEDAPPVAAMNTRKIRPEAVWAEVRKAWEGGETARSVAKRYDVGLHALWKRREAEGWRRPDPRFGPVEPADGWDAHAERQMAAFELRREEARMLAKVLAEAMAGGPLDTVPLWHVGFVLAWRAERLSPEAAARDRAWAEAKPGWVRALWDEAGRLKPVATMDALTLRANREAWREDAGLPDGAAAGWP